MLVCVNGAHTLYEGFTRLDCEQSLFYSKFREKERKKQRNTVQVSSRERASVTIKPAIKRSFF